MTSWMPSSAASAVFIVAIACFVIGLVAHQRIIVEVDTDAIEGMAAITVALVITILVTFTVESASSGATVQKLGLGKDHHPSSSNLALVRIQAVTVAFAVKGVLGE